MMTKGTSSLLVLPCPSSSTSTASTSGFKSQAQALHQPENMWRRIRNTIATCPTTFAVGNVQEDVNILNCKKSFNVCQFTLSKPEMRTPISSKWSCSLKYISRSSNSLTQHNYKYKYKNSTNTNTKATPCIVTWSPPPVPECVVAGSPGPPDSSRHDPRTPPAGTWFGHSDIHNHHGHHHCHHHH